MKRHAAWALVAVLAVGSGAMLAIADVGWHRAVMAVAGFVSLTPIVVGIRRGRHDLFEPSYLFAASFAVLFVVRPIVEWSATRGVPLFVGLDPNPTYFEALLLAVTGAVSFFVGYYSPLGRKLAAATPRMPERLNLVRVSVGATAIAVLGMSLYAAFLVASGGVAALAALVSGRNQDVTALLAQPLGYLYSGLLFLFAAGVAILVSSPDWRSRAGLAGFALIAVSLVPEILSGSRSVILPALLSVVMLWYLRRGTRPRLATIVFAALAGFIVIVSIPRDFRNSDTRQGTILDAAEVAVSNIEGTGRDFILGLDTAMLPALAIELQYVPDVIPYRFGSTFAEAALRPVPRALWVDKPEAADTQLMRVLWPDFAAARVGFSFSVFGEPFLNFGVPGVILILAAFGAAWSAIWQLWQRQPHSQVALGIFAISWPFLFVYVRGGIGVDYQRQAIALLPFLAIAWYASRTQHASISPGSRMRLRGVRQ